MKPKQAASRLSRANLGFLLAKAMQRWNELLYQGFTANGFAHVRPSFGSILIPLYEEDGLRLGAVAARARLSKQAMTSMIRLVTKAGLVRCKADPDDARATRVYLTAEARRFAPVANIVLATLDQAAALDFSAGEIKIIRKWLKTFAFSEKPSQLKTKRRKS